MVKMTPEEAQGILSAYAIWQQNRGNYLSDGLRRQYDQLVMDFMREWVRTIAEFSTNPHRHEITEIVTNSPPYPIP